MPFGREGAADRAARAFLSSRTPTSVGDGPGPNGVIENLPGAGGLRGIERANALARQGEAVLLLGTPTTHILLPGRLGPSAAPDPAFVPVAGFGFAPNVLLISPRVEARSVRELAALARREPLTYASAGAGQTIHVCTELFCEQAGIRMTHRPYEAGSASAYTDLAAGDVHVYFDSLLGCIDQVRAGEAVPLAVSSSERHRFLPGVPTLEELGYDHALDVWLGIFAAHLERPISVHEAANGPLAAALATLGLSRGPLPAADFGAEIERSKSPWRAALEAAARQR